VVELVWIMDLGDLIFFFGGGILKLTEDSLSKSCKLIKTLIKTLTKPLYL